MYRIELDIYYLEERGRRGERQRKGMGERKPTCQKGTVRIYDGERRARVSGSGHGLSLKETKTITISL